MSALFDTGDPRASAPGPAAPERAAVTLTYEYGRSQVWLDDLRPERDPHAYDLCRRHAARLSVPLGWHLADRRRAPLAGPPRRLRVRPTGPAGGRGPLAWKHGRRASA